MALGNLGPSLAAGLRPIRGSWTLVLTRFFLIVTATAPAWAKGWSLMAKGPARQPYFTDVTGPLPLPHVLQMFKTVGDAVPAVALGCAAAAVLLSALLTAGALAVLSPDRPDRTWRGMVAHAWSEGWEHLPAFLRILLIELATLGLGLWLVGKAFDRLDITARKGLWTAYTQDVTLPLLKLVASGVFMAAVGAWGLHTRLLTVADERRKVRRTALLALRIWLRRPWGGPGLFVVCTLAGVLLSGWVLVSWRQAPPDTAAWAWMRMVTWAGVLLLLAWLWHFLLRAGRILADRPDVVLIRSTPDEGFGLLRFVPFVGLLTLVAALAACQPSKPTPKPKPKPAAGGEATPAPAAKPKPEKRVVERGPPPKALEAWCTKCHKLPPPSILTRNVWPAEVAEMAEIAGAQKVELEGMTAREVAMWYGLSAPERHSLYLGPKTAPGGPIEFIRKERSAAARKKLPGVSNVRLVDLLGTGKPQVLFTEMSAGQVLLFDPARPQDGFRGLGKAKHPGRATVVDLDADGIKDVLVSDLGVFYPSDDKNGAVIWLRGRKGGKYEQKALADKLGRVADSQAADLDGDGDLDVAAAVFGWRAVGQVLALERAKGGKIVRHTLLQRTGALHVTPRDLDGDGRMDLVVLFAQEHERVSALMNRGGWKFEEIVLHEADHPAWGYSGMQVVDLDGDKDDDVLLTNGDTLDLSGDKLDGSAGPEHVLFPYHGVSWLENGGGMKFTHRALAPMYGAHRAQAADLDGDGDLDVVASAYLPAAPADKVRKPYRPESLIWLERRSPSEWVRHTLATHDVEIPTLDVGDLDGDGDADIVTGHLFLARLDPDQRDVSITLWESRRAKVTQ